MSTSAPSPDDAVAREVEALAAQDRLAAIEERLEPEQAFEQYDGPLGYSAWLRERARDEELSRLGIGRVEVPAEYAEALGVDRSEDLRREIQDRLIENARSPKRHDELAAQSRRFGELARALDLETGKQVVGLEYEREELREEMNEAAANDLASDDLDARMATVDSTLDVLSEHKGHPDRWMDQHGSDFAAALAARHHFRRERELEAATTPAAERDTPGLARETADAGFDAGM
jgi:antitoxin component of MazEF toxin-antitoxin module